MAKKPLIYIAGPLGPNDAGRLDRVGDAIDWGNQVLKAGGVPIIPHLTHYFDLVHPQSYETWLELDFEIIRRCDILLRFPGESPGADREVAFANGANIPVINAKRDISTGLTLRDYIDMWCEGRLTVY